MPPYAFTLQDVDPDGDPDSEDEEPDEDENDRGWDEPDHEEDGWQVNERPPVNSAG